MRQWRDVLTIWGAAALLLTAAPLQAQKKPDPPPAGAIQLNAGDMKWTDGPAALPPGTKVAVLEGDPKKPGPFTMRIRLRARSRIAPHWHPREERVSVISGSLGVGFGEVLDTSKGKLFKAGAYYVNPAKAHHYVWTDWGVLVQITGNGPWELKFLEAPKKEPKKKR